MNQGGKIKFEDIEMPLREDSLKDSSYGSQQGGQIF